MKRSTIEGSVFFRPHKGCDLELLKSNCQDREEYARLARKLIRDFHFHTPDSGCTICLDICERVGGLYVHHQMQLHRDFDNCPSIADCNFAFDVFLGAYWPEKSDYDEDNYPKPDDVLTVPEVCPVCEKPDSELPW